MRCTLENLRKRLIGVRYMGMPIVAIDRHIAIIYDYCIILSNGTRICLDNDLKRRLKGRPKESL